MTTQGHAMAEAGTDAGIAEAILATIRQPLIVLDGDLRVRRANAAFCRHFRIAPKDAEGRRLHDIGNGEWDIPSLHRLLADLPEEGFVADFEIEHDFPGLGPRCLLINARRLGRGGREGLIVLAIEDITDRRLADGTAGRLAAIVDTSDDAIVSKTLDGIITSWNAGAVRMFGYAPDEIIGKSVMLLVPPDRQDEERGFLERLRRGEHVRQAETMRQCRDGHEVWVSLTMSPLKCAAGHVTGASTIARDVTERRRARELRKTLMHEINHRMKNTMAVIQSIASQTLGHAASLEEARDAFAARLVNLAQVHDALMRDAWQGADLAEVVADTIRPHAGGTGRFDVAGPAVRLAPKAALAMAMALHELCTNAVKHGALSAEAGRVAIRWRVEGAGAGRRFVLGWQESGGPPVLPPGRRGFGSRLLENVLTAELGGSVRQSYAAAGFACTITAPMPGSGTTLGEPDATSFGTPDGGA